MGDRTFQKSPCFSPRLVTLTLGCLAFGSNDAIQAQIVPDNTVGSQVERVNAQRDRITEGTARGSNLFHSFREFNISEGRAAYFANPAAIKTIFSRVTGNNPSQIFGTLGVEGNANLFFINPNGIIFGPNATLDVRGSFIGSTANSIVFPNGENFSATNPNAPPLLTIDVPVPIGLVFESDNSGIILNSANLETRQNLALIGAGIGSDGRIEAPGGDITLATVPGAVDSIVGLDGTGKFLRTTHQGSGQPNLQNRDIVLVGGAIDVGSTGTSGNIVLDSAGDVLLSDEAAVDVRGGGGGSITVNAQNLEINRSDILAGIASGLGSLNAQAGDININATESVKLQGGDSQFFTSIGNQVNSGGSGNAGNININTKTLEGSGAFQIGSSTFGRGNAGRVNIQAKDTVSLKGVEDFSSGIFSAVEPSAIGNGGGIEIETGSISLFDGAILSTFALGQGNGGNLTINATESVRIIGTSANDSRSILSTGTSGKGKAGNLTITTGQLLVRDGGSISTLTLGSGDGGNLTIDATESVRINSNSFLSTGTLGKGKAGDLAITTRHLLVRNGGSILTSTSGFGDAGNLTIDATESVRIIGTSADDSRSFLNTGTLGKGKAGNLTITTGRLLLQDGAEISTTTGGDGNGGNLTINVTESVRLIGSIMSTGTVGKGNAGNLLLNTKYLLLQDGGIISTDTINEGNAGRLIVNATESVQAIGVSANNSPSGLFTETAGKGKAGDLRLNTRQLSLQDGARISTRTQGEGNGGILTINASESIQLSGVRASNSSPTRITSEALGAGDAKILNIFTKNLLVENGAAITVDSRGSGIGGQIFLEANSLTLNNGTIFAETASTDGGNLNLDVQDLLLLRNGSQISTTAGTAQAGGDGGRIFIDAGSIVAIPDENSDITANAFEGDGGQVFINTESIFGIDFRQQLTPLSDITASSQAGRQGEVIINTSGIEPTRGVEALTEERINVEVAQGCQVGGTASGSISFYHVGRGGLPPSPDDLFNSSPTQEWLSLESQGNSNSQTKVEPSFSQQPNNIVASQLIFSCQVR
jgi:filamentous hemagglutinin family protein